MKSSEIRQKFLDYFASKGHTPVASSSLVPQDDPTLLFTNAGMVQFKNVFLGREHRPYVRATSSQKCVRAGGKHNDLENVGYTARHHTFFEMLGNFSFGNYFKKEAIKYAWEFLTETLGLPTSKLWVTVHAKDAEAKQIWLTDMNLPAERVIEIDSNDNFWQMGDTGPCGYCSEIFFDHGEHIWGGLPGTPEGDGDRYIEIWNMVFMQYNRDENGVLHELPKPSIDTGMGLERISAVMQNVHNNYEIDSFQDLIKAAARETDTTDLTQSSLKVLADHIRSCSFLIADGVVPSSDGRGYVLRRILRRAIRHGYKLGQSKPFFHKLVDDLAQVMGNAYPELIEQKKYITDTLLQEELRFAETLEHGMALLEEALKLNPKALDGETAFKLYDTYGFPIDLTMDIARERDVHVDVDGYEKAMENQREMARKASHFTMRGLVEYDGEKTEFKGYDFLKAESKILAIYKDKQAVDRVYSGEKAIIILDKTPFYAESGGQVGDQGQITCLSNVFLVQNTQKIHDDVFGHEGIILNGELKVGEFVHAEVNLELRRRTALNHSATHLLHSALRQVLGTHVHQKGSMVSAERLRFDFSHPSSVTRDQLLEIENLINDQIRLNHKVETHVTSYAQAVQQGAMALFDEKYGDNVRVVSMGGYSTELCGGTHAKSTGDIGFLKIVSESSVASGVRRIEAVTGENALRYVQDQERQLSHIAELLKTNPNEISIRIENLIEQLSQTQKQLDLAKTKLALNSADELLSKVQKVNEINVLSAELEGADAKALRDALDKLKDKLAPVVVVLGSKTNDGKVSLVAGVSKEITAKYKAGEAINHVAQQVGGKGGGRPDMAQAGGTQPEHLTSALNSVIAWVESKL